MPAVRSLRGLLPQEQVIGAIDAGGERDYGNIDTFDELGGEFNLSGEFGDVYCRSDRPVISLQQSL